MSIVYILTNPAFPRFVKVGKTKNLRQRLKSLDNSSTPMSFRCEFAAKVDDMDVVEKLLHDAFGDRRVRENREFFECELGDVGGTLAVSLVKHNLKKR